MHISTGNPETFVPTADGATIARVALNLMCENEDAGAAVVHVRGRGLVATLTVTAVTTGE